MKKLPKKPSALIRLAVKDLIAVEKDPQYEVSMDQSWYERTSTEHCTVCFAGAVIANSITLPPIFDEIEITPETFESDTRFKLRALDYFRQGDICNGLDILAIGYPKAMRRQYDVTPYAEDRKAFKQDMLAMAKALADAGL